MPLTAEPHCLHRSLTRRAEFSDEDLSPTDLRPGDGVSPDPARRGSPARSVYITTMGLTIAVLVKACIEATPPPRWC